MTDGLFGKYLIKRTDGMPLSDGFKFILSPENDPAALRALETYAAATNNRILAQDLQREIDRMGGRRRVKCENCFGTGESDYGPELWQTHACGKCGGSGFTE